MLPGAEILVKCLEKEEVEVIFGYPGGATLDVLDALARSDKIRHILVRNEQGAAHAASGYARASGKTGVCLATSGPGATNLVTGIATAYMDSIPLVILTGQVPTAVVGTDAFQEVDITGITDPITKHNYLVQDANELSRIVKEAFYIAKSGRPGPVLIDIPKDVQAAMAEECFSEQIELRGYKPKITGHAGQIKQVAQLLFEAESPLICAGGGVISSGASSELQELAETMNIPVVTTMMGIGSLPFQHPLNLGMLGTYGLARANMAVQACDLFLALGMRFDDRVTGNPAAFAPLAKIIHIDIDAAEIGKNVRADVPLVGDLRIVLGQLNARLKRKTHQKWFAQLAEIRAKFPLPAAGCPAGGVSAGDVVSGLNGLINAETIITTDVGQHQMWAAQLFQVQTPRTFISSGGLGTMGYGIPAALGAQIACPRQRVVTITGDGSFQMGMTELGTALEQDLPLKIMILNNMTLGMVKQLQDHYCEGRYTAVNFRKNPDFLYLAKAYGALYYKAENKTELVPLMEKFLQHPGMAILEIIISCEENVYPMVLAGKGLDEMVGLGGKNPDE